MGNSTGLGKALILMVCINILLYLGGVRVVDTGGNGCSNDVVCDTMGRLISDSNSSVTYATGSNSLSGSIDANPKTSTDNSNYIDNLGAVLNFLGFLFNIVFTPIGLFVGSGMPVEISILIGIPLMVVLVLALAYFMRSGS